MRTGLIAAAIAATVAVVAAAGQPRAFKLPHTPFDAARLSHDARMMTTGGEGDRLDYLVRRFKQLGLKPAGEHGGWFQTVPLLRTSVQGPASLSVSGVDWTLPLMIGRDAVVASSGATDSVHIDKAELVFVGRGQAATDLTGKVAVVLGDAPQADGVFGHLFGRRSGAGRADWSRVVDACARRGAEGVLVVHDPATSGDSWPALAAAFVRPQLSVDEPPADGAAPALLGWLDGAAAAKLFARAGFDYAALKHQADDPSFQPVRLAGAALSADFRIRRERLTVRNVLARLPGAQSGRGTVVYSAGWRPFDGASAATAAHGATMDEATGLAALLELARVYSQAGPTQRSVLFAAFADDAHGHFGSDWFMDRPVDRSATMIADFDVEALQTAGPSRDIVVARAGQSTLVDDLAKAAARQGRRVVLKGEADDAAVSGGAIAAFQRHGAPVLALAAAGEGPGLLAGGRRVGEAWLKDYLAHRPRSSAGAWTPEWDLSGAAVDLALIYEVGRDAANAPGRPHWTSAADATPGSTAPGRSLGR